MTPHPDRSALLRSLWLLCLGLQAVACTDSQTSASGAGVCGRGTEVWAAGQRLCVYEQSVVIETGFSCPDGMTGQVNFTGVSVCGGAGLDPALAGQAAIQVDPGFSAPGLPGPAGPSYPAPANPGSSVGTADAGTADAGTADAGTADAGTADAGTADAGTTDAGTADAGTTEAGTADAATADATGQVIDPDTGSPAPAAEPEAGDEVDDSATAPECASDEDCADSEVCLTGTCVEAESADDPPSANGMTPPGRACGEDADCGEGQHCDEGGCVVEE